MKNLSISTSIVAFVLLTALLCIQCKTNETVSGDDHKDGIENIKETDEAASEESTGHVEDRRHIDEGTSLDEVVVTGHSRKAKASPEADYSAS